MGKTFLAAMATLFLSGCASYDVRVDAISSQKTSTPGNSYYLFSGLKGVDTSDLQFQEYAHYIDCAMAEKGYTRSKDVDSADVALFLSYGIGDPKESMSSYAIPVYGQTGVSSAYTSGSVRSYGSNAYYSGTTTFTPQYGLKGFATGVKSRTTYFRYFLLDAFDLKTYREKNNSVQLWSTKVTSNGSSGDLRTVFPVMVGAAKEYFGRNTGKQLSFDMYDWSPEVVSVKCDGTKIIESTPVEPKARLAQSVSLPTAGLDKKVYLKDGSILNAGSINFDSGNLLMDTPHGRLTVPANDVLKIE